MKKNMYSVLLHFFLFVCLVIPLHTTANAANTTDDCLQILTSDFNSNSAQEFIGTQHLNITDSQYQTIRTFTLDLTEKYSSTKDKITAICLLYTSRSCASFRPVFAEVSGHCR